MTGAMMAAGSQATVLLVDDDAVFREAVAVVLETRYRVRTAANGSQALAMIGEEQPDLLVLDMMMDHMAEGFDVARTLRSEPATSTIPIIMLTGVDKVYNLRMQVDEDGIPCDRYLEKPVDPIDLLHNVEDLLHTRSAAQ